MKKAFTLAEVLITLAIIGVVAAITIPAVIQKSTNQQYVTGLQKAYNTLKSVEQRAIADFGEISTWSWGAHIAKENTDTFNTYFRPYLDILKDCGTAAGQGCFAPEGYTPLNSNIVPPGAQLYDNPFNNSAAYKIITSDGVSYAFRNNVFNDRRGEIVVDINGPKGPNKHGRDFFMFYVFGGTDVKGVKPLGYESNTIPANCGWSCGAKVISEGAMNY